MLRKIQERLPDKRLPLEFIEHLSMTPRGGNATKKRGEGNSERLPDRRFPLEFIEHLSTTPRGGNATKKVGKEIRSDSPTKGFLCVVLNSDP